MVTGPGGGVPGGGVTPLVGGVGRWAKTTCICPEIVSKPLWDLQLRNG